ncbi:hypothetical protein NLJ89_g2885 [Agrocybe chaxingu]|uniref:C2H2-type domain-containing protein n=1 Tax=Agrocybe chaxingu TaxID=84603 RepID=A0A9W8K3J8_9AGAR|nr:hypothetical protein NLJ89_g2885 [Agrocybe chaxingu]
MSDAQSYAQSFDSYNNEFVKQSFDFLSFHSPSDVLAPHPDLFESDIDSNLAAFPDQLQLLTVDSNDAYSFFRTEKPQWPGPLSTITVSSESYDSRSSYSDSFYNEQVATYAPTPISANVFDFDLDMDFRVQRVRVGSEYSAVQPSMSLIDDAQDPTSFGPLPPTPPRSPALNTKVFEKPYGTRSSFSDYCPPSRRSSTTSSDYYSHLGYSPSHSHVSPLHISTQLPAVASVAPQSVEEIKGDPRKKYKCTACPRAFARAYNLKTHMATHDPNRLKPHVCPQKSCGRSFSRKHDLGRHLISIHRDEPIGAALLPAAKKAIGVEGAARGWCDQCGKGWVGRSAGCDCADVK